MWVFGIFVAVSIVVFIAGYRLISAAPEDPAPPDFNDAEAPRGRREPKPARERTSEDPEPIKSPVSPAAERFDPIHIHYSRALAAFLFVCSLVILAASFMVGVSLNSIAGAILLFASVAYFVQPAFVVQRAKVEFRNVAGMTVRETPFESLGDFAFEDGAVWIKRGETRVKVIGLRMLYSGGDLAKLEAAVRQSKA
jgi:hypothetical protein